MWGTLVERERKRRIDVAVWAYAYEIMHRPLVSDAVFDATSALIDIKIKTENTVLDNFFATEFSANTGMWIHRHPDLKNIHRIFLIKTRNDNVQLDLKNIAKKLGDDLNAHTALKYDDGHRRHLGASQIGDSCSRKLWYGFRWCATPNFINAAGENHKGRMLRLFNRGHKEEARFVEWLTEMGCTVLEHDPDLPLKDGKPQQFRIEDVGGHFGGSCDGKIKLPANYGIDAWMLLEFKTSSDKYFGALKKAGVRCAKPIHFAQMSIYANKLDLRYGLYMCVNKNTDEIYIELVDLGDTSLPAALLVKAENIIKSKQPPARLSENSAYSECKFCDFASVCHGQSSYEKSCRSCSYATPIMDKKWHCDLYKQEIPTDFVVKGCSAYQEAR